MNNITEFPDNKLKVVEEDKSTEELFEQCKEVFKDFVILGYDKDNMFRAAVTGGLSDGGDILYLMEMFKHHMVTGTYSE